MDRQQKEAQVAEVATKLSEADTVFAIDYRGISVTQSKELRAQLRDADASFSVVKNRLAKRAAEQSGTEGLDQLLIGPTALTFIKGDPVLAAKALSKLGSEWELLEFKGGLMDGAQIDPDGFKRMARLPGVDVLRGQLVGMAASPLTGVVRGLGSLISGLAIQLGQMAEQGLVGGDAPGADPEAAAAEETAEPEGEATETDETPAEAEAGAGEPEESPADEPEDRASDAPDPEAEAAPDEDAGDQPGADQTD